MQKVICIKKCNKYMGGRPFWYSPEVGDEVTVKSNGSFQGAKYYTLLEYPGFAYDARYFATLPDTTADELEEAIVNLETA